MSDGVCFVRSREGAFTAYEAAVLERGDMDDAGRVGVRGVDDGVLGLRDDAEALEDEFDRETVKGRGLRFRRRGQ